MITQLLKMKRAGLKISFFILSCTIYTSLFSQVNLPPSWDEPRGENGIRVVFYNVENLFDTVNNPNISDEEYLPKADKQWNSYKYWKKVNNISKVIVASGGWEAPDIVGLCEVENDTVLNSLTKSNALKKVGYNIVHYNSPDRRGIDVALLYNPAKVELLYSQKIAVTLKDEPDFRTRDILYVKALSLEDTLHFFVNHWPSRRGGQQTSEYKRINAAEVLKFKVDSIQNKNLKANIVLMGDFNDSPENTSINRILNAGIDTNKSDLINMMALLPTSGGSHKYKGHWDYLDQFIVSPSLNDKRNSVAISDLGAQVLTLEWLLQKDSKYPGYYPKRSWKGDFFSDGFSDHLPIIMDILITPKDK